MCHQSSHVPVSRAKNSWKSKWVQFGIHGNRQSFTESGWWGNRHHVVGHHTWHLFSKTTVSAWVTTIQLSCGMGECPGFSYKKWEYPCTTRCFATPLAAAWIFSSSSVRQNHNLSAVWFEKQVANGHLQGKSMKLVTIDDAQRGKKLLNQWSERKTLRLMVLI